MIVPQRASALQHLVVYNASAQRSLTVGAPPELFLRRSACATAPVAVGRRGRRPRLRDPKSSTFGPLLRRRFSGFNRGGQLRRCAASYGCQTRALCKRVWRQAAVLAHRVRKVAPFQRSMTGNPDRCRDTEVLPRHTFGCAKLAALAPRDGIVGRIQAPTTSSPNPLTARALELAVAAVPAPSARPSCR